LDQKTTKKVLDESAKMLPFFSMSQTPPKNATPMYHMISKLLEKPDLYYEVKEKSIQKAQAFIPDCKLAIKESSNPFLTATKIAVAGNVIDLASEFEFDLGSELEKVLKTDFAIDDSNLLFEKLQNSVTIIYLADNAGENVFDRLYIETLKSLFKDIEVYYFVRSTPIINDITYDELKDDTINEIATLIDSGVQTPGIIIEDLTVEAKALFDKADCIISKGMGNFECLSENLEYPIYYLLKVKCNVVADALNKDVGDIICKSAQKI
jgi:uncharacterized protein with ATP-grasp and redox domains